MIFMTSHDSIYGTKINIKHDLHITILEWWILCSISNFFICAKSSNPDDEANTTLSMGYWIMSPSIDRQYTISSLIQMPLPDPKLLSLEKIITQSFASRETELGLPTAFKWAQSGRWKLSNDLENKSTYFRMVGLFLSYG